MFVHQSTRLAFFAEISACECVPICWLGLPTVHCRNATPLLVTFDLFAGNFPALPPAAALSHRRRASSPSPNRKISCCATRSGLRGGGGGSPKRTWGSLSGGAGAARSSTCRADISLSARCRRRLPVASPPALAAAAPASPLCSSRHPPEALGSAAVAAGRQARRHEREGAGVSGLGTANAPGSHS
jgi:hypothetical protein